MHGYRAATGGTSRKSPRRLRSATRSRLSPASRRRRRARWHSWRLCPEPLDVVYLPRVLVKDVQDDGTKVDERPLPFAQTFTSEGASADFAQLFLDMFGHGLHMSITRAARDHEKVGVARAPAQVGDDNLQGFAIESEIRDAFGESF